MIITLYAKIYICIYVPVIIIDSKDKAGIMMPVGTPVFFRTSYS